MMRTRYISVSLVIILAAAGYFALWKTRSNDIEFRQLTSPEGFRELVLANQASSLDPLLAFNRERPVRLEERDICLALFQDPSSPKVGGEGSKIIIVEFFDYRCPYCKKLTIILSQLRAERGIGIVYKEWPVLGDSSILAARAALAAAKQGKYLEFHTRLMNSGFIPTLSYIDAVALELGIDEEKLAEDMNAPDITIEIERTANLAAEFGFRGTPGLVLGRTIVQGAITRRQLESLIENELSSREPLAC